MMISLSPVLLLQFAWLAHVGPYMRYTFGQRIVASTYTHTHELWATFLFHSYHLFHGCQCLRSSDIVVTRSRDNIKKMCRAKLHTTTACHIPHWTKFLHIHRISLALARWIHIYVNVFVVLCSFGMTLWFDRSALAAFSRLLATTARPDRTKAFNWITLHAWFAKRFGRLSG